MDVLRGVRTLYISTMYILDNQTVKNMYKPKSLGLGVKHVFALFSSSAEYNICISDAQDYELSAQQNLWCEILEF